MTGVLAAALLVPTLTACGGDSDFCEREVASDVDMNDPEAAKEAIQDAVDDAPDDIKDDLQLIVDQLDALEAGDLEDIDQSGLMDASDNIETWYEENCA